MRRQWYELSGGEAQRVALAARLALQPRVLLLDEPTASVDAASVQRIKEAVTRARRRWGTTLVIASHDWQWLYEICDQVLHMFDGRVSGSGTENMILGPWQPAGGGRWCRQLPDGQVVLAPEPPHPDAVAVIAAGDIGIRVQPPASPETGCVLEVTVVRLLLEKSSGSVVATIAAENLPLTVKLPPAEVQALQLYPGGRVWAVYAPQAVRWL
jgi:tungstate transport system ATP-binding protein